MIVEVIVCFFSLTLPAMKKLTLNPTSATIIFAITLAGCASPPAYVATYVPPMQVVHLPETNVDSEAEIGQTIISTASLTRVDAVVLANDVSDFKKAELLDNRWSGTTNLYSGTFEKSFQDADGSFYRDPNGTFTITGAIALPNKTIPCECGVFVYKDSKRSPVTYVYRREIGSTGYELGKTPVSVTTKTIERWSKESFKRELIYGGLSGNTISISYREFVDGTARPAFTQDIKYDLGESKVIGFRGARFEVIKASNVSLRYKVLKPLD